MKKKSALFLTFIFILPIFLYAEKEKVWQEFHGLTVTNFYSFCFIPRHKDFILAGTDESVIKINIQNKDSKEVLSVQGDNKEINYLASKNFRGKACFFAATGNGLYLSRDTGKNWARVFEGKSDSERICNFVETNKDKVFVATNTGLFYSRDLKTWNKPSAEFSNDKILNIVTDFTNSKIIYLASAKGVFKSVDNGDTWQRIFVWLPQDPSQQDQDDDNEKPDSLVAYSEIKFITQDKSNSKQLYLATDFGIFHSQDSGKTWQRFNDDGIFDRKLIQVLAFSDNEIYALSRRNVFEYDGDSWHNIYRGLDAENLRFFDKDYEGNLWLATKEGLFKTKEEIVQERKSFAKDKKALEHFNNEPTIQDIQKVAIRYAEVHPNKIKFWRSQAKVRAIMPELGLTYDKTIYSYGGDFLIGPKDWGVNFKWDLADLIYNPEQTSIDVRSRLMVQLRDDILNEVTRLYFERRRLQVELLNVNNQDSEKYIQKQIRLEELTASIDALTGGYLTKALEKNNSRYSKNK